MCWFEFLLMGEFVGNTVGEGAVIDTKPSLPWPESDVLGR